LDTVEHSKYTGQAIEMSAERARGLVEHQIQTWGNTGERFRGLIIKRIRCSLESRIAQEWGERVERSAGYSNDDNALRGECGIYLEPEVSESTGGGRADLGCNGFP